MCGAHQSAGRERQMCKAQQSTLSPAAFFFFLLKATCQQMQRMPRTPGIVIYPKWIAPPEGFVKINVDAGVSVDHNLGTAAAICRDRDGGYLGSSILVVQGLVDPVPLKAIACREGLSLAQDMGLQNVHIAMNSALRMLKHIR